MVKNKKQFGVWLDSQQAVVAGRKNTADGHFVILAHAKAPAREQHWNENATNNAEKGGLLKLFKEITSYMQNVDEILVTGTGNVQEQFIHYLAETPQFKNAVAKESTSTKMSDEKFLELISAQFN